MATATAKEAPMEQANGTTPVTKAIEANVNEAKEATAKTGNAIFVWLRKLPLASLGLVGVIGDETKVFVNRLFMNKLVERGEQVQKDAEKWMKDAQARFR
jgi:hypothetical protein